MHQATIYRRWGTMTALLHDVVNEWSATTASLPDTGSLRDDLHVYAGAVATSLRDGNVPLILRAVVMEIHPGERRDVRRRSSNARVSCRRCSTRRRRVANRCPH